MSKLSVRSSKCSCFENMAGHMFFIKKKKAPNVLRHNRENNFENETSTVVDLDITEIENQRVSVGSKQGTGSLFHPYHTVSSSLSHSAIHDVGGTPLQARLACLALATQKQRSKLKKRKAAVAE
jgi:hypothetical protein